MSRAAAAAATRLWLLRASSSAAAASSAWRGGRASGGGLAPAGLLGGGGAGDWRWGGASATTTNPSRSVSSEAALRARRLAAAQARRQQQHERAAARLARARPGASEGENAAVATTNSNSSDLAPSSSETAIDPGDLNPRDARAVARAVAHPALVVTRAIEWGTVVFGFEQANKYTVFDQDGQQVALIAEEITGVGNALQRQLLRTRRAFTATVLDPVDGSVLFRVRRPPYLVSSTTYVETADGESVGEVRQRWHPLRRNFDLYVGRRQYAKISGPLLAWEFELTDDQGRTLALIDRNFQGFAKELFTDAGKYAVHFGYGDAHRAAESATRTLEARSGRKDFPAVKPLEIGGRGGGGGAGGAGAVGAGGASAGGPENAVAVIPQTTGGQLAVVRPLALDERMVALAAAVAIDFAFFSQHSHTSGMFAPPLIFPMPYPGGGGGGGAAAGEEAGGSEGAAPVDGGGAAAGAGGGGGVDAPPPPPPPSQEEDGGWSWADDDKSGGGGGEQGDSGWSDAWGGGEDDGDDDGEGGGTVGSVVRGLWRVFGDDD